MVNIKYKQPGVAVLAQFPVYPGLYLHMGRILQLIHRGNTWPHGKETVQALAEIPLLMLRLQGTGAHIIDDGVPENIILYL